MPEAAVTIRECVSVEDFQQCIDLEREVWKDDDIGIMPIRLYMISKACKAPTIGAFDSTGRLVGFVHTMLALMGRHVVFHSHLAAVLEDMRHQDIGMRMKLAQRKFAIEAGIPLVIWTFDPLQSRNAHLNINKLGAIIKRYEPNYYSEGLSRVFAPGVPSDRIFAEWWVNSAHVRTALEQRLARIDHVEGSVTIPSDINRIQDESVEAHTQWVLNVRDAFKAQLARGLIVKGFERDPASNQSRYLFAEDEQQFNFDAYEGIQTNGANKR